ncbi:hypothetical protein E0G74_01365 [Salmonella enterica]|nr:hypothetical protein [Salmonella enterica]
MKNLAIAIALITASGAAMAQGKTTLHICFNAETDAPALVADTAGINRSFAIYDLDKAAYGETKPMWKPIIVSATGGKISSFSDGEFTQAVEDSYSPVYMVKRNADNMSFIFHGCSSVYKPEEFASFLAGQKLNNYQLQILKFHMGYAYDDKGRITETSDAEYAGLKFHESDFVGADKFTPAVRKENQAKSDAFFAPRAEESEAYKGLSDAEKAAAGKKRISEMPIEWATKKHHVISTCDLITVAPVAGKYSLPIGVEKGAIKIIENGKILTATFKHVNDEKPSTMKFAIKMNGLDNIPSARYMYNSWDLGTIADDQTGFKYMAENCQIEKQ